MTRRTISTAHTVVVCAVCERTLLRGEHAEPFIAGGQRRMVCELCAPRAIHEGWLREDFDGGIAAVRTHSRSRGFFDRLRQRRDEFLGGEGEGDANGDAGLPASAPRDVHAIPTNAELKLARAVEVFNASDQARMIAGVARSLGLPSVTVRASESEGSVVWIVAAWEITWYRFEVDLGNEAAGVRRTDQGAELDELEPEDLAGNGLAAADGSIALP